MTANLVTLTGNLAEPPAVRFTGSGKAVAGFRIAHTPRRKNTAGEWEDGTTLWMRCDLWGTQAEQIADLAKGTTVMVTGRLVQQDWESKTGEKRTTISVLVDDLAVVVKPAKGSSGSSSSSRPASAASAPDPWADAPSEIRNSPF